MDTERRLLEAIEFEGMIFGHHLTPPAPGAGGLRLERSAYTLLSRLEREGSMTIAELRDAFGLDLSTLSRQTGKLVATGLVSRTVDSRRGAARKLSITAHGRELLQSDRTIKLNGLKDVVTDWPAEELDTLFRALRRFNESADAGGRRPWPRLNEDDQRRSEPESPRSR